MESDGKKVEEVDEALGFEGSRVLEDKEIDRNGNRNLAGGDDLSLTRKPGFVDGENGGNCKVLGDGEVENLKSRIEAFDKSDSDLKVGPDEKVGDVLGSISQRTRNRVVKGSKDEVKGINVEQIDSELTGDDDDEDDDETEFSLGDFVWGKIKSYPWWPGRIYDPSNASEFAMRYKHEGRLLVAYFGDRTFAWCHPSQLKPFEEDFEEMSKKSSLKNFVNAVNVAVNEYCFMVQITKQQNQISLPLVENAGIKEGVRVSLDGIEKFSDIDFDPKVMLDEIRSFSISVSVTNLLVLGVLKSHISAFYQKRGGYSLPEYYEPLGIEEVEEKDSVPINGLAQGPDDEDWCEIPGDLSVAQTGPETPNGKSRKRRKVKSMVELLGLETKVDAKEEMEGASKSEKRKRKFVDKTESATKDEGRSEKKRSVNSDDLTHAVENSVTTRSSSRKKEEKNGRGEKDKRNTKKSRKERKLSISVGVENGHIGVEELQWRISPREKKISKYLSPPYTSPLQTPRSFGLVGGPPEFSDVAKMGERMTKAAGKLVGFPPISKCSGEKSSKGSGCDTTLLDDRKIVGSPDEVLCELRSTARNPYKVKSFETNEEFLSSYRSANYRNGSDYKLYKKHTKRKRTSSNSEQVKKKERKLDIKGGNGELSNGSILSSSLKANKVDSPRKKKSKESEKQEGKYLDKNTPTKPESEPLAVIFIKQKLEEMNTMLAQTNGKLSDETKSNLENNVKELLKKVKMMTASSSSSPSPHS